MKRIYETAAAKQLRAWALLKNGVCVGKAFWHYSTSGNTVKCEVHLYTGLDSEGMASYEAADQVIRGKATGYGYCKTSAALWSALTRALIPVKVLGHGNGKHRSEFEAWGYDVVEVL